MGSLLEANQKQKKKYGTLNNTKKMFPVGSRVRVICLSQDFYFFDPDTENTKGTVIRNNDDFSMIIVQWDEPRHYEGGHIQVDFNFDPEDLVLLKNESKKNNSPSKKECYEAASKFVKADHCKAAFYKGARWAISYYRNSLGGK